MFADASQGSELSVQNKIISAELLEKKKRVEALKLKVIIFGRATYSGSLLVLIFLPCLFFESLLKIREVFLNRKRM